MNGSVHVNRKMDKSTSDSAILASKTAISSSDSRRETQATNSRFSSYYQGRYLMSGSVHVNRKTDKSTSTSAISTSSSAILSSKSRCEFFFFVSSFVADDIRRSMYLILRWLFSARLPWSSCQTRISSYSYKAQAILPSLHLVTSESRSTCLSIFARALRSSMSRSVGSGLPLAFARALAKYDKTEACLFRDPFS